MTKEVMLNDFKFPVKETSIKFNLGDKLYENYIKTDDYKAIIRDDTGDLIHIANSTYNLVTNEKLINNFMQTIDEVGVKYYIEPSHSFVTNQRMRLHVAFPELTIKDDESLTNLSLYLHNSYNGSEGIRLMWGAMRLVCTNGMVIGHILKKMYHRHTSGFLVEDMKQQLESTYKMVPMIQERIDILNSLEAVNMFTEPEEKFKEELGVTVYKEVGIEDKLRERVSAYALLNAITYHISHNMNKTVQAKYQGIVSNLFTI